MSQEEQEGLSLPSSCVVKRVWVLLKKQVDVCMCVAHVCCFTNDHGYMLSTFIQAQHTLRTRVQCIHSSRAQTTYIFSVVTLYTPLYTPLHAPLHAPRLVIIRGKHRILNEGWRWGPTRFLLHTRSPYHNCPLCPQCRLCPLICMHSPCRFMIALCCLHLALLLSFFLVLFCSSNPTFCRAGAHDCCKMAGYAAHTTSSSGGGGTGRAAAYTTSSCGIWVARGRL